MNTLERTEAVYTDYYPKVRRYIAARVTDPQEAEDLVSEVFLKVCQRLDGFDETKASVSTWVYAIAKNTVIDYYRTRRAYEPLPETLTAPEESLEDDLTTRDTLEQLAAALETLEERQRDIILLRYYRGMTLRNIGERMHLSYSYVKVLHSAALSALRKQLQ